MLLAAVLLSAVALSVLGTPIDNRREPNAVTGVEETGEAPDPEIWLVERRAAQDAGSADPDRGSNWLDEGRVAPDPEIWAVERRAAQDADSASIWTVENRAPAIAKS